MCEKLMMSENSYEYKDFLEAVKKQFEFIVKEEKKLFVTNAEGLFDAYLNNLPEKSRQHYNCKTCKSFIEKYGALVTICDTGKIKSVIWNENFAPDFFKESVKAMKNIVLNSKVEGVFISEIEILGQPATGKWKHLSVNIPSTMVYHKRLFGAKQVSAEKLEDFRILKEGLKEYKIETVKQAFTLLKSESLYGFEKCLSIAEWLMDVHNKCANNKNSDNILWKAVATAPNGYCHIKSSMIGTLLDDIVLNLPFETIRNRFNQKMDPLNYQRPKALPTEGNIARAEKIVKELGIEKSLVRRFARVEELEKVWVPKIKNEQAKKGGVFAHIKTKSSQEKNIEMPPITITFRKFSETVLPLAEKIEYLVENKKRNYSAILTASYSDAPPILQWDREEKRNPFSWYVYHGGSEYKKWNLSLGYCTVNTVCMQPSMWFGDYPNQSKSVFFILEGAKDTEYMDAGNAIFPANLKSELREIRSTIEAYSKSALIEDYDNSSACGIKLEYGNNFDAIFRVTNSTGAVVYKLDRWD